MNVKINITNWLCIKQRLFFGKTYGYADLERKTPVAFRTNFRLASVTKKFTAKCILMLVEQGKLSYDATLKLKRNCQTTSRGWMRCFPLSESYRPLPELDEWIRHRISRKMECYIKQWRRCRT